MPSVKRPGRAAAASSQSFKYTRHQSTGIVFASGGDGHDLATDDVQKDGTGCHCLWPAAERLCEYLLACGDAGALRGLRIVELGSGVGVPGMLAARLGAPSVTLTDYHPLVLRALSCSIAQNELDHRCRVQYLSWDDNDDAPNAPRWPLVLGADLSVSSRAAVSLAGTVRRCLARAPASVFVYAHTERRAIFRDPKTGAIRREPRDSALLTLKDALKADGLECFEWPSVEARGSAVSHDEPVRLFAFGRSLEQARERGLLSPMLQCQ